MVFGYQDAIKIAVVTSPLEIFASYLGDDHFILRNGGGGGGASKFGRARLDIFIMGFGRKIYF